MRLFYATVLVLTTAGLTLPAHAEVLQMPESAGQSGQQEMRMPVRGMHKDQVRAMFGQPREVLPPVGDPPITRWVYDGYIVYFEYSYVIQSVAER
jgi:hypothetical protein